MTNSYTPQPDADGTIDATRTLTFLEPTPATVLADGHIVRNGTGRGSDIRDLPAGACGLLLARFLEPGRAPLPDIDNNFERGDQGTLDSFLDTNYGSRP